MDGELWHEMYHSKWPVGFLLEGKIDAEESALKVRLLLYLLQFHTCQPIMLDILTKMLDFSPICLMSRLIFETSIHPVSNNSRLARTYKIIVIIIARKNTQEDEDATP